MASGDACDDDEDDALCIREIAGLLSRWHCPSPLRSNSVSDSAELVAVGSEKRNLVGEVNKQTSVSDSLTLEKLEDSGLGLC